MSTAPGAGYVLGVAGSPRRHGNSDRLLDSCLDGVSDAGVEARRLIVADADIAPCRGCNACSSTGECVVHDGMDEVYPLLDGAGALVVATPVFFATVPAVLKALYDRLQPYWARRYVLGAERPEQRAGAVLVACSGGDPYGHECAVTTTCSALAVMGVRVGASVVAAGVDSPSDMGRHPDLLARARAVGRELAAGL